MFPDAPSRKVSESTGDQSLEAAVPSEFNLWVLPKPTLQCSGTPKANVLSQGTNLEKNRRKWEIQEVFSKA